MKRMESCKGTRLSQRLSLRVRLWISRVLLSILTSRTRRWLKEIWVQERNLNLSPGASSSLSQEQLSNLCSTAQEKNQGKLPEMLMQWQMEEEIAAMQGTLRKLITLMRWSS